MAEEVDEEEPVKLSDFSLDVPGTDWLFKRWPEVFVLAGSLLFLAGGVAMILSNPAGNSTDGDAYGPDAPLQLWVVLVAVMLFVVGALLAMFLVLLLWQRVKARRSGPHSTA